jgi:hypothetical protein
VRRKPRRLGPTVEHRRIVERLVALKTRAGKARLWILWALLDWTADEAKRGIRRVRR